MFDAIFGDDPWFLVVLTAVASLVGGLAWLGARRHQSLYAAWYAPLGFCLTGILGVTLALRAGESSSVHECVINHELTEPLRTTQGLWNLAMCLPLGLFGILALRRALPVVAGVVLLPCLIEIAQALAPVVSGICDSADVEMNIAGGLIGFAVGGVLVRGRVAWSAWVRPVALISVVVAVATIVCGRTLVTLNHVDGSTVRDASGSERTEAERVIRQAFGDRYQIGRTQVVPGLDGYNGRMSTPLGATAFAELTWPGARKLDIQFDDASRPVPDGFPVPGARVPHNANDAYRIAEAYMRAHYPWAAKATSHRAGAISDRTGAIGDKAAQGWLISWRFTDHKVVMPRSLDVQINRAGRVSRLQVDFGPEHLPVSGRFIEPGEAEKQAARFTHIDTTGGVHAQELKADQLKRHGDPYRIWWVVTVSDEVCDRDPECQPTIVWVDAVTGKAFDGV